MRRKIRNFAERMGGNVDWRQDTTPTELEEFYRLARDVPARTYQERKLDAGLPIDDGVLSYAHVGYDPKIADLSPGTVLQWHVLEALFAEKRHRVFDFTQGEGDHKRFFSTEARQCANVVVLPFSLRGWAVALAQFLCDRVSTVAGDALDRLGLKRAIRRVLRR